MDSNISSKLTTQKCVGGEKNNKWKQHGVTQFILEHIHKEAHSTVDYGKQRVRVI